MAHNDTEIEIKIPLGEKDFLRVKERIQKEARFVKKSSQSDEYFNAPHRDFLAPKFPFEWLSIRKRGDKAILNYKHWHPENAEIHTHCDELETEISEPEKLEKIFSALGFKKLVTVEKERETYNYNDEFEIGLDKVKDLGYFIEIETIKDFGSVEKARKKLFEFAAKIGIDASKPDERGYPFSLMKKGGLLK
ncbi:class IV adenylate cyclase [Patescibacteria group bacterium]|nr:class IV adenylate cyclase [Patescibacteria group bacterium]MBU3999833.1 class IV adenylate cyclase [Patescibacteria group bacterium]MBU4056931.1 class IV adenylate cyclase [Patescibacteria group bacterium]MBU4369065.1 class IV adenylate cyclase [Patescibacteria group bacterium]